MHNSIKHKSKPNTKPCQTQTAIVDLLPFRQGNKVGYSFTLTFYSLYKYANFH